MKSRVRYERELVQRLRKLGMVAFRLPASGSKDKLALDVVAWDPNTGQLFVFEVKSTKGEIEDALRLLSEEEKRKAEELKEMGVKVFLAVRKLRSGWTFIPL